MPTASPGRPPCPEGAVAIAGAGIAGLVLATALARLGRRVIVLEARGRDEIAREGLFLTLAPNGLHALAPLGLDAEGIAGGIPTRRIVLHDERGRPIAAIDPTAPGDGAAPVPAITLRRGALAARLCAAAEAAGAVLRFATPVTGLEEGPAGVTLATPEGPVAAALAVGADGLHSALRRLAFPAAPAPAFAGLVGAGGILDPGAHPLPAVPASDGTLAMTFCRRGFFGWIREGRGPVHWYASWPAAAPPAAAVGPEAAAEALRRRFAADPPPIPAILAAVPALPRLHPQFDLPAFAPWHRARVVLIGDAAHAVGPHAGQGAALAVEDALLLAACLAGAGTGAGPDALAGWEALRRPRIAEVARVTARNGGLKLARSPAARLLRNLILPLVLPRAGRDLRRLAAYRADREPAAAALAALRPAA